MLLPLILLTAFSLSAQSGETFEFDHEVKMDMKQYKGEKLENTSEFVFLLPDGEKTMGLVANVAANGQEMQTKAVFDMEAMTMTTLMDQGGMKMGMKMDLDQNMMDRAMASQPEGAGKKGEGSIKKTGRTKKIMGYQSEEYEAINDGSYSLIWISNDVGLPSYYESFAAMSKKQNFFKEGMPTGFLMEMTAWPEGKGTKEKFEMNVTEINKNKKSSISTEGYKIMQMPSR